MDEILAFLLKYCSDLYKKYGFKFINSEVSSSFSNAALILENEILKIRFITDKGQLFLDFHSKYDKKNNNWYSFDLIRQLITGEDKYYSILDENNGQFIQKNLENIFARFKNDIIEKTLPDLNSLEKKRAKVLFG